MSKGKARYFMKIEGLVGPIEYDGSRSWFELRVVSVEMGLPSKPDGPRGGQAVATKDLDDGGWQLISQWLSTGPKDVTFVLVYPDDRGEEYKVSREIFRCELQGAKMVGTPTWTVMGQTSLQRLPDKKFYNFVTFVLTSPRVRLSWVARDPNFDLAWRNVRATAVIHRITAD